MDIKYHKDRSSQLDYKDGAIDIRSSDPSECFQLGVILGAFADTDIDIVHGSWGHGKFIRVPLTKTKRANSESSS